MIARYARQRERRFAKALVRKSRMRCRRIGNHVDEAFAVVARAAPKGENFRTSVHNVRPSDWSELRQASWDKSLSWRQPERFSSGDKPLRSNSTAPPFSASRMRRRVSSLVFFFPSHELKIVLSEKFTFLRHRNPYNSVLLTEQPLPGEVWPRIWAKKMSSVIFLALKS